MSIEDLSPRIRDILRAPVTDLKTISAKRVRLQLLQDDPSLSGSWVKENKTAIDKHIASIFEEVSREGSVSGPSSTCVSIMNH